MRDDLENDLPKAGSFELDQTLVTRQRRLQISKRRAQIFKRVGKPVKRGMKDDLSDNIVDVAVDLSDHKESVRELIDRCLGVYEAERDLLKDKLDHKYHKTLNRNPETVGHAEHNYDDVVDKGHNKAMRDAWKAHHRQNYQLKSGRVWPEPRLQYLYPVWRLVQKWWQWKNFKDHEKFDPDFYYKGAAFEELNSAARLILLIIRECDNRYTLSNCMNLQREMRKQNAKERS